MNDRRPRVSVGMPVYNGGEWLEESIQSILSQSFQDFELVISDNGSTDNTADMCRQYAQGDQRVRYYRNEVNIGASGNYNAVFRHSRSEYFKWASSNDICGETFLEKCVEALDAHPDAVLACPRTRLLIGDGGGTEDYDDRLELPFESPCERFRIFLSRIRLNNVMNGLIRSRILAGTPLIKTYYSSDVNLMAELTLYGKFIEIPEYLFYRRMDPESATYLKSEEEVLRHYDPTLQADLRLVYWRINSEYFSAVWRSPLSWREKSCLYRHLSRRLFWDRRRLARELYVAVKRGSS